MEYKTTYSISSCKNYSVTATQKNRDGHLEGGYNYCIFYRDHIISIGTMSCFKFSDGLPDNELKDLLSNHIDREPDFKKGSCE